MIEGEQPLVGERGEELNDEERIAAGLLVHQLRQRRGARRFAAQGRRRSAARHRRRPSGASAISCTFAPASRIAVELAHQRMGGVDLVVPIGADQQQVPHVRLGQQVLEQVERRRVEPLQIVEEQRQRMLRPGEHADEAPEHQLEAALRVLRRQAPGPAAARR